MKLYVDDIRTAPDGWQCARTVTEAIRFISMFGSQIEEISLDHDISYSVEVAGTQRPFPSPENFSAVAHYIVEYYQGENDWGVNTPKITIHSANPVGSATLKGIFADADFAFEYKPMGAVNRLEMEV